MPVLKDKEILEMYRESLGGLHMICSVQDGVSIRGYLISGKSAWRRWL